MEKKVNFKIVGIQSWDFTDANGKRVQGSKLYVEHIPAKQGTVGKSYESVKILPNVKEALIELLGSEENAIGQEFVDFGYDKYQRVNDIKF